MISSRYSFVFLHVPKTGGNSVQHALLPHSDDRQTTKSGQDGRDRFGVSGPVTPFKHARLSDYEARLPGVSRTHTIMISVRHPFDRALSYFFSPHRWMKEDRDGELRHTQPIWNEADFFQMLDDRAVLPMADFLRLGDRLVEADILLRFETLEQDFRRAVKRLGLPAEAARALPHVNRSVDATGIRSAVRNDPGLRDAVERRFRDDMELFHYLDVNSCN
ncbi:sulfotransferase family 2 domain-containing protein [Salipiger abyssi]|uniref:sulfotransferase family 2 domain-containing protein n=1 Tax=Salipiger abyssi TaxID=1250539 RepID=UPI0040596589